jgi:hypothetical protein
VNAFTQTPLLRDAVKRLGGVAPERQIQPSLPKPSSTGFGSEAGATKEAAGYPLARYL